MRKSFPMIAIALAAAMTGAAAAQTKDAKAPRPELFQKLIDCRAVSENTARLACYDAQVARLDDAETRNEVAIVDKEQIRKARRGLFGFTLPDIGRVFGGDGDGNEDKAEITTLESTIQSAYQAPTGDWVIILEDGAKWRQTDQRNLTRPKPGQPIRIRRAAMGSFLANVNNQIAIRIKREN